MNIITRSQFLKDLRKGWKGLKFQRQVYRDDRFYPTYACALGAASFAAGIANPNDYTAKLPLGMFDEIANANDNSNSKAQAYRTISALKWPKKYAA